MVAGIWLLAVSAAWGQFRCEATQTNPVSCFGGDDGEAFVTVIDGVGPYTYLWNDPLAQTSATASGLTAGPYSVTVTDAGNSGAITTCNVTITEPIADLVINLDNQTNIQCIGATTGIINITLLGGTPDYDYSWTGPDGFISTDEDLSNLAAGTYDLLVNDINGCTEALQVIISQPDPLNSGEHNIDPLVVCENYNPAELSFTTPPTGGTPPYSYQWFRNTELVGTGATYDSPQLTESGLYEFFSIVSDACTDSEETDHKTIRVEEEAHITISGGGTFCLNDPVVLTSSVSGGTGTMVYHWLSSPNQLVWFDVGDDSPSYTPSTGASGQNYYRVHFTIN
ncbi:hypothetical protein EG832_20880, partial [bacterium]|nr:hypothetical protein [bacterium]